ncbi:MAG: threonine/serine dehydratase [Proteobacteria bacterium]|nr:threonine/serine dehydratase [Pseudomonadota bacterium]
MTDPNDSNLPTFADVEDAAERLRGRAVMTPLLESPLLNERIGGRVLVKAETLQRTGSFKFRGAYNRISRLSPAERKRGVVAYSSGNHAQGVAAAARLVGAPAVIVMPADAPRIKIDGTRALGAEVVLYDRSRESREAVSERIATERGLTLVPPYDDPRIIAGQGTAGLELAAQAFAIDAELDAVLSPCGGGGLIAGCALALSHRFPGAAVYAVEPEGFDDTTRSLAAGERQEARPGAHSFCDALLSPTPGKLTFAINRRLLAGGLVVSDDEVARAMRVAFLHLKLVLEPGGATALAALLAGGYDGRGKTVAVVASGGNVDPQTFAAALERAAGHDPSS